MIDLTTNDGEEEPVSDAPRVHTEEAVEAFSRLNMNSSVERTSLWEERYSRPLLMKQTREAETGRTNRFCTPSFFAKDYEAKVARSEEEKPVELSVLLSQRRKMLEEPLGNLPEILNDGDAQQANSDLVRDDRIDSGGEGMKESSNVGEVAKEVASDFQQAALPNRQVLLTEEKRRAASYVISRKGTSAYELLDGNGVLITEEFFCEDDLDSSRSASQRWTHDYLESFQFVVLGVVGLLVLLSYEIAYDDWAREKLLRLLR